ncbi:Maph42 [Matsumuraeses phaseoli granulovirus]|uniref:Maph42 n=1 Tax=Matsumuraeses phaseoli granulovirus TaxID=2760664 RepID=A0AAE7MLC0_9BBAC|nr:Maph42 [Matsumuraeses phaseoli granulovirus]QOD40005.1 Maph42 [Matsumuraeses phaseoli granulovirus]
MDKKVDAVNDSFVRWAESMRATHANDKTIDALVEGVEDKIANYLNEKKRKFIKIENLNMALFASDTCIRSVETSKISFSTD